MSENGTRDEAERDRRSDDGPNRRTFLQGSAATIGAGALASSASAQGADASTYASSTGESEDRDPARATGSDGMVSSVHPQASRAGADVLRNGGNAIDAAVAVQFALNVVQPHSSGIGGGGFMVVYVAEEDEVYTIDNRERAPLGADKGMFLQANGEPIPFEKRRTLGEAVGVPGTLRACDVALKRFGTRGIPELIGPAIDLAAPGCAPDVTVDATLAEAIAGNKSVFNEPARRLFAPGGEPLKEGDTLAQPELAETFRTIRDEGIGAFYKGEIGKAIAEIVRENGGSMRPLDLARYNVTVDHPEYAEFNDVTVRTQSLPSSGGLTIGQILKLLEPFDLERYGFGSAKTYEAMLEAFGLAYADRGEYMGDKAFVDAPWQGLFDEAYLEKRRQNISVNESAAGRPEPGDPWSYQPGDPYAVDAVGLGDLREGGNGNGGAAGEESLLTPFATDRGQTTHFTTADAEGNMVSWTSTIEQFFGTGIMVPGYGFMLNNELTDFDAVPGGPNEVMPGKRPLSSTSPTIVFKDGKPYMTVGSPGGKTIITTVAQIVLNVAEFGMSVEEAIAAPRVYTDADPAVYWESGVESEVIERLRAYGFDLNDEPMQLGNAQAIYVDRESDRYVGVADWRREGAVIGL